MSSTTQFASAPPSLCTAAEAAAPHRDRQAAPLRSEKITEEHLQRSAIVYVRQSTQQQVFEHRESTARQYALADRAVTLGWPAAAVDVIDEDQGHSGSSAEGRNGFQRLLGEVSSDHVGIILGLEMSRLARSCKDWHALAESNVAEELQEPHHVVIRIIFPIVPVLFDRVGGRPETAEVLATDLLN